MVLNHLYTPLCVAIHMKTIAGINLIYVNCATQLKLVKRQVCVYVDQRCVGGYIDKIQSVTGQLKTLE